MTKANLDALVAQIALRQCGVFSRAQALALGMTDSSMFRRIRACRPLDRAVPGRVPARRGWRRRGTPRSGPPAVGRRAARDGDARDVDPAERFAPRRSSADHADDPPRQPSPGAGRRGPPDRRPPAAPRLDRRRASGQPARTRPSSRWPRPQSRRRLGRVLDDLVFDRRTTYERRRRRCWPRWPGPASRVSRRSPPCSTNVRTAPFRATASSSAPCSPRWPAPGPAAARNAAGRPARRPVRSTASSTRAYSDCRLIIEADGRRWHTRVADLRRDHERDAEAARVGWQTAAVPLRADHRRPRWGVRRSWPTCGRTRGGGTPSCSADPGRLAQPGGVSRVTAPAPTSRGDNSRSPRSRGNDLRPPQVIASGAPASQVIASPVTPAR